ncbi:MAG: hypothetical protein HOV81_24190 [Kofleriaceae bacterium]|nr:hypothetical protein [Kofleriaceae bacterium]
MRLALIVIFALAACTSDEGDVHAPKVRAKTSRERPSMSVEGTTAEPAPPAPPPTLQELVDGGTHWRITTAHGPVHVWIPKGYDERRAETIVYVHGFYTHVDGAWTNYKLATQFAASAINAMFIACEAPASGAERVSWDSLADLLAAVEKGIGRPWPKRRVVAIGHSGAWRTLLGWLDEPRIDTIVLVDAAYGEIEQYKAWILGDEKRRLIDVGDDTRQWTDALHAQLPDTVVLDDFPSLDEGMPRNLQRARIVYIKSKIGHMPLVTDGVALPMLLRTLRAKRLVRQPLSEILASP